MKTIQLILLSCLASLSFGQDFNRLQKVSDQKRDTVRIKGMFYVVIIGDSKLFFSGNMIHVEGGTLEVSNHQTEEAENKIILSDFYISDTEVTNLEFASFLNSYGSTTIKDGHYKGQKMIHNNEFIKQEGREWIAEIIYSYYPVTHVTWYGAYEYCRWLSEKTGQNYHLPTEAQWEYAAKGGQKGFADTFYYSGSNHLGSVAWYKQNSTKQSPLYVANKKNDKQLLYDVKRTRHQRTRRKKSNQLGLHDMSGNVSEWCADWYKDNYVDNSLHKLKVFRGGSWRSNSTSCRINFRNKIGPAYASNSIGFRIARD